jgi:hypothetical protein
MRLIRHISSLFVLSSMLVSACGEDEEPNPTGADAGADASPSHDAGNTLDATEASVRDVASDRSDSRADSLNADGSDGDATDSADRATSDAAPDALAKPSFCRKACETDANCRLASGQFIGLFCEKGSCVPRCDSDAECADRSQSTAPVCTTDTDCAATPNTACVTLADGKNHCVPLPTSSGCTQPDLSPLPRPKAEGGGNVSVCLLPDRCTKTGMCVVPCAGSCELGRPKVCDQPSGECICMSNADCEDVPDGPICDVATGRCGCATGEQCRPKWTCS